MSADDDDLVTKGYLREQFSIFRAEFGAELRGEMAAMEKRLLYEIGHAVNVIVEQTGAKVAAVLDDKYAPLQPRIALVERSLEEHRADYTLHKRPRRR